ncbi:reprolysin-like metallopeptidase [Levilactobacillus zymae]|uniref:reprolysin-like metallopeptidase n=1 Tax=Levilactobacillus zymae TaxID=267363 RepID=UPI0028B884C0|nr:matrixin family metalloprotease [Levilactobacillus zymae]MDT6981311.1 matrixin family metalloprotease [Levilactobacillus zymae]
MRTAQRFKVRSVFAAAAAVLLVTPIAVSGTVTAHAASVKPSASVLKKSNSYYRKHAKTLGKKYKLVYDAQTALKKNGKAVVWVNTSDKQLKKSVQLAMDYWNHKLGKKEFTKGSKKNHTLTFSVSHAQASKSDNSDAWWTPGTKKVQVRWSYYQDAKKDIAQKMSEPYQVAFYKQYNTTITSTAKKNLAAQGVDPAANNYSALLEQEETKVAEGLKAFQSVNKTLTAINNSVAAQGRMYEYAGTIAHEFGHTMGLDHSPNAKDLMYYESGTNKVYSYKQVTTKMKSYNPVTATDKARAQLALKIYVAAHK